MRVVGAVLGRDTWRAALLPALLAPLAAVAQITVELGPEQTVMAWNDGQPCTAEDVPDQPARAFVDADGRVHLIAGMGAVYQSFGDNLDVVRRDCSHAVWSSHNNPDPRAYDDWEGLWSPYTVDGQVIYALVHNEYHGWEHGNCSAADVGNCWWNAVTLIRSDDGGATYHHSPPLVPPAHVVASSPYDFDPANATGPFGFFEPSNVVESDHHWYAFVRVQPKNDQAWGVCLMRTSDLADPASWRAWDGQTFSIVLDRGTCPTFDGLGQIGSYLSYNAYFGRHLLVGNYDEYNFYFSVAETLTSWPHRQVLWATDIWWSPNAKEIHGYPALLQPGDPTRNFEKTGRSPWFYYTYLAEGAGNYERELRRRRVRFSVPGDENRRQVLELPISEYRGSVTLDASFYGNDALLENGAVLDTTQRATGPSAARLPEGTQAQLRVRDAPSLDLAGSLTIEAFVRVQGPSTAAAEIVTKDDGFRRNYRLAVAPSAAPEPGVLAFSFSRPDGALSASAGTRRVADGHWHHVAVVYDAETMAARYYVDGTLDVERMHGAPVGAGVNDADLVIGTGLTGALDAVVVHDHVRSPEEIARAAVVSGNVELCNGRDDDGDGVADEGFSCISGATETRACASAEGGVQVRTCRLDCTAPEWPACAEAQRPPASHGSCGCGSGGQPSVAWVLLAVVDARRRARSRRVADGS